MAKKGAPIGNKNAKGKRVLASNVGGLISGVLNPKAANKASLAIYQKRGAGATGYKAGMVLRRISTLGLK